MSVSNWEVVKKIYAVKSGYVKVSLLIPVGLAHAHSALIYSLDFTVFSKLSQKEKHYTASQYYQ